IGQRLLPFSSPYSGPHSLEADGDTALTHTYGAYFGAQLGARLQGYLDVEMARGHGIGNAVGLGGITNGDVIRQGTADLGRGPYLARAYLRYLEPIGDEIQTRERGQDQLPGVEPARRVEVKLGLLAATDDFDLNRYANDTRTQFMNWGLINDTAWDYAADTRGYTRGIVVGYVSPTWSLRAGSYQMPTQANGNSFDGALSEARGDNLELTVQPAAQGTVARLLAYQNHARMGVYRDALDLAQASGTAPDVRADERPGRRKFGFGLNLEQPLADEGETGAFLRWGWNDGRTESFAFTEVDGALGGGVQIAGRRWGRDEDRIGIGVVRHTLSADHRDYLAAGGSGFLLGDGRLNYGPEEILEAYYRIQLGASLQLSPDLQYIENPGYNRDRGPAQVYSLRLHIAL